MSAELIAWAREQDPNDPLGFLAHYTAILEMGFGGGFLQTAFRVNFAEQADLKPLKLDHQEPVT